MPPKRVMVFIDYQNCYKGARDAFFDPTISPHKDGQFDPLAVGQRIANATTRPPGDYVLSQVRIYTGRPDPRRQSRTYTAHMKQCDKWTRSGVVVTPRMLRYPYDYPARKPEEKGIDVALAIDFIAHAMDDKFDIGVLFSTDTDLRPPLEFVHRRFSPNKSVEVAAWSSNRGRRALNIPDVRIWCHHLELATYNAVADTTDYNL